MINFLNMNLKWCPRRELNSWPLPYQGSALPLSYVGPSRNAQNYHWTILVRRECDRRQTAIEAPPEQAGYGIYGIMAENKSPGPSKKVDQGRQARLARALRKNLRRRKAQQTSASSEPSRTQKDR